MRHTATFLLTLFFVISCMTTAGCASRITASIQAVSEPVIPHGVTWTAVPGPDMPADDPAIQLAISQTAVPLATALSLYDWEWLSNPAQAEEADIIVCIRWNTSAPRYLREFVPVPRHSIGFGMGWGYRPWHRGPFYGGYYAEPTIHTIYTRTLIIEALRANALPPAVKAAILHLPLSNDQTSSLQDGPAVHSATSRNDITKPPYAPPLKLKKEGAGPENETDQIKEGPYAPPILDSAHTEIPSEAVIWSVEVSSISSRSNTRTILPQLAAAAAQAVGKTIQTDVFVDGDLHVTYNIP